MNPLLETDSDMACDSKGITQFYLSPTHEPYLPLLPSYRASSWFGWYSLHLSTELFGSCSWARLCMQVLVHRSHALLHDDIVTAVYNMAAVDFASFYGQFLPHFLQSIDVVDSQHTALLLALFHQEQVMSCDLNDCHMWLEWLSDDVLQLVLINDWQTLLVKLPIPRCSTTSTQNRFSSSYYKVRSTVPARPSGLVVQSTTTTSLQQGTNNENCW